MKTIEVPRAIWERLHRLADADGVTLAQEIERLMDRAAPKPKPRLGGYSSGSRRSVTDADDDLLAGFGE